MRGVWGVCVIRLGVGWCAVGLGLVDGRLLGLGPVRYFGGFFFCLRRGLCTSVDSVDDVAWCWGTWVRDL